MHAPRYVVSLRIFSQTIDPSEVCEQLGMEPKWKHKIGEPRTNPKGVLLGGVYDWSYCSFSLIPHADEELHEMLNRIVDDLLQHETLFRRIQDGGGRTEFFIGWFSTGDTGDTFSNVLLSKLGMLRIDLALDVYGESMQSMEE
ncbi:MAG: DUF4279 domain-containing protein [Nitrospira sp.]|jgi:hypothetical protein|nr:DUF4279 domain-containing protein [Nitrospira sp.]